MSYSILGPSYVSPNCIVGEKESEGFFPEDYMIPDTEPEEPKKKKKRFRGSKSSLSSSEMHLSDMSENVEEELEEELMEEITEENLEDDDTLGDVLGDYQEPADLIGGSGSEAADKATSPLPE